jgi:putative membrane protein
MKPIVLNKFILGVTLCVFAAPVFGDDMSTNLPVLVTPADFAWDASLVNLKEIRLGEAAQSNSQDVAVQEFGSHMVRDHSRMNVRLQKIAEAEGIQLPDTNIFNIPVQAPEKKEATELMNPTPQQRLLAAQVDVQDLVTLTGADFDKAYADAMVKGHEKAVQKFQDASASLSDDSLKKYADRSLRTIRDHYDMAQKLQGEVETNTPSATTNAAPNM